MMILTETILFVREIFAVVKAIASKCGIDAQQMIRAKKFASVTFAYMYQYNNIKKRSPEKFSHAKWFNSRSNWFITFFLFCFVFKKETQSQSPKSYFVSFYRKMWSILTASQLIITITTIIASVAPVRIGIASVFISTLMFRARLEQQFQNGYLLFNLSQQSINGEKTITNGRCVGG